MAFRRFRIFALLGALTLVLVIDARASQSIPFEFRDGLIWVKVKAEGRMSAFNFVLDSGAGSSVVTFETAARMKLKMGNALKAQRVGSDAEAARVTGIKASVAGVPISTKALALDLSSTSATCSRPIDGLIGQDFFRGRIVQIDFKAEVIRLLDTVEASRCCTILKMRMEDNALCVPVSVNGSKARWTRLDTGCDDGLHWVRRQGDQNGQTSLQLGEEHIANVKTTLHEKAIFPSEAGLLGTGVLARYIVTVDAVSCRLLLQKS